MSTKKKKRYNLKSYVLFRDISEDYRLGGSLSHSSEELFQRGKGRARIYSFCWEKTKNKHVAEHQKITANHKKTRHVRLMILVLFYIWEDAKVWAH